MRLRTDSSRNPADVETCRKALKGLDPQAIAQALEVEGDFKKRRREDMRACLKRLFDADLSSSVVAGGLGVTAGVVADHWRNMGLKARARPKPDLPGEVWKRLPGWRMDVSSEGRVRNLAGRHIKLSAERGKLWVRHTGSDADPQEKRMFSVATAVLAAFRGVELTRTAKHLDGDALNCRLVNLQPDKLIFHRSQGPTYLVPPDPAAAEKCRGVLSATDIPANVVEGVMMHREGDRDRQQWRDADRCIRALVEAGIPSRIIADGIGVLGRVISDRRQKMGLHSAPRIKAEQVRGERWRRIPGHKGMVSNLGRYRGGFDALVAGSIAQSGRPRVKITPQDGSKDRVVMIASLVLGVWRGYPLDVPARHLNGDILDCRLKNLEVGMQGIRPCRKRGDTPWTLAQDNRLRKATSYAEAAAQTGHTLAYTRKRMQFLGVEPQMPAGTRRGVTAPLTFRNLSALDQCVAVLQDSGVDERTINLGLNIIKQAKGEFAAKGAAMNHCIVTLHEAGVPHAKIRDGVGLALSTYLRRLQAIGIRAPVPRPVGSRTLLGPIDEREGEEWRTVVGFEYLISSMGRVASPTGYLLSHSTNNLGDLQVSMMRDCRRLTRLVARLVLEAFKPHLTTRTARHLNGDKTDNRVDNLVPRLALPEAVHAPAPSSRPGNVSDQFDGSLPLGQPLWVQANRLVPAWLDETVRRDLVSEMILLVMEGHVTSLDEALAKAKTAYNRMMGVWSETSLDAPLGDDGGATRIDMLTSDSEFISTGQVRARRQ